VGAGERPRAQSRVEGHVRRRHRPDIGRDLGVPELADVEVAHLEVLETERLSQPPQSYFVELARTDPEWAWLLIRLEIAHNLAFAGLGPFAQRDLDRGIKAGRFEVPHKQVALFAAGGARASSTQASRRRSVCLSH
jgi:hypothetical protein